MASEAQKRANKKYLAAHYSRLNVSWPNEFVAVVRGAADAAGVSVNGYLRAAVEAFMASGVKDVKVESKRERKEWRGMKYTILGERYEKSGGAPYAEEYTIEVRAGIGSEVVYVLCSVTSEFSDEVVKVGCSSMIDAWLRGDADAVESAATIDVEGLEEIISDVRGRLKKHYGLK